MTRGEEVVRALREDGGQDGLSYDKWAAGLQGAVCEAVEQGLAGSELERVLLRVYGSALVVVEDRLLPGILSSRHMLFHAFALEVWEDLRSFWYGTDAGLVPEAIVGAPRPEFRCRDAAVWRDWLLGCCDWLSERAEAHRFTAELLASGSGGIAPGNLDQIVVNCYGTAVVVAGSAAGWATSLETAAAVS